MLPLFRRGTRKNTCFSVAEEVGDLDAGLLVDAQAGRTISISFVGTTAQRDIESVAGDRMMGGGEGHQSDRANLDRLNGDPMMTAIESAEA